MLLVDKDRALLVLINSKCPMLLLRKDRVPMEFFRRTHTMLLLDKYLLVCNSNLLIICISSSSSSMPHIRISSSSSSRVPMRRICMLTM